MPTVEECLSCYLRRLQRSTTYLRETTRSNAIAHVIYTSRTNRRHVNCPARRTHRHFRCFVYSSLVYRFVDSRLVYRFVYSRLIYQFIYSSRAYHIQLKLVALLYIHLTFLRKNTLHNDTNSENADCKITIPRNSPAMHTRLKCSL